MLAVGAAVQGFIFVQSAWEQAAEALKTIGQPTVWRSANYGHSQNLAEFVVFLHQRLPAQATVFWPGQDSGSRLPGATLMQMLLFPRRLLQCPATGCEDIQLGEETFFVAAGNFPGATITQQATRSEAFNERWGVLTINPAGFEQNPAPSRFRSLLEALLAAVAPALWMLLLTASGALIVSALHPQADFYFKAALGFGLGTGMVTVATALLSVAGFVLRPATLAAVTGAAAAAGLAAWRLARGRKPASRSTERKRSDRPVDSWVVLFVGLAAVSAMVAVGKGYHVSDELLIWAPKGYGIAGLGTIAGVTGWGTNTLPYPLQVPMLIAAFNLLFGDILPAAKLVFSTYYLALLLLVYSFLRHTIGVRHFIAGCCTLLVASAPLIFRHSTIAYANLPYTLYLASAAVLLAGAAGNKAELGAKRIYLLSGMFFMLASWTRPEGVWMAWLLIVCVAAVKYGRQRRLVWQEWAWLVAPMGFYQVLWWMVSRAAYLEGVERSQIGLRAVRAILEGNLHIYEGAYVVISGISRLLGFDNWGVWGAGLMVLAAAGLVWWIWGRGGKALVFLQGWLVVGMVLVIYFVASYDGNHDISWWVSTGLERMLFPGVLLLWMGGIQVVNGTVGEVGEVSRGGEEAAS